MSKLTKLSIIIGILSVCLALRLQNKSYQANENTKYKIINKIERKDKFFTQGLSFIDSETLLESSGLYGRSDIHLISYPDLKIKKTYKLEGQFFGEGSDLAIIDGKVNYFMLTWQEKVILQFDENLQLIQKLTQPKEISQGWGLTRYQALDKKVVLVSDGSNKIYHVDPQNLHVLKTIEVKDSQGNVYSYLNELEMYKGDILANVFMQNTILRINPNTGEVKAKYNFTDLVLDLNNSDGYKNYTKKDSNFCLNGIAYDPSTDKLLITGKMWPFIYEIQLIE